MAGYEPMTDKWLETLAREIAIPLQAHPAGPVAQIAQRNALAGLNYLVKQYQDLRAALEREQNEHANCEDVNAQRFQTLTNTIIVLTQQVTAMRPIVEAVTVRHDGICMFCRHTVDRHAESCPIAHARAFVAAYPMPESEAS